MSCPNFSYENRCVVITDEDYENGHYPETLDYKNSELKGYSRNYSSSEIDPEEYPQEKPLCHFIVITAGYYADACIDFIENEEFTVEDWMAKAYYYGSAKEWIEELAGNKVHPKLTKYRIQKLLGKRGDMELEDYINNGIEKINEWLMEQDAVLCNEIVDHLKDSYGLDEIARVGVFSNGEAVYKKIG